MLLASEDQKLFVNFFSIYIKFETLNHFLIEETVTGFKWYITQFYDKFL